MRALAKIDREREKRDLFLSLFSLFFFFFGFLSFLFLFFSPFERELFSVPSLSSILLSFSSLFLFFSSSSRFSLSSFEREKSRESFFSLYSLLFALSFAVLLLLIHEDERKK